MSNMLVCAKEKRIDLVSNRLLTGALDDLVCSKCHRPGARLPRELFAVQFPWPFDFGVELLRKGLQGKAFKLAADQD
jgi:hypothetical protein